MPFYGEDYTAASSFIIEKRKTNFAFASVISEYNWILCQQKRCIVVLIWAKHFLHSMKIKIFFHQKLPLHAIKLQCTWA